MSPTRSKSQPTRPQPPLRTSGTSHSHGQKKSSSSSASASTFKSAPKSSFISQLRSLNPSKTEDVEPNYQRAEGFSEKPVTSQARGPVRDDTLTVVEDLEPGPSDHKPPADDPSFEKLEPNSGIRLKLINQTGYFITYLICVLQLPKTVS